MQYEADARNCRIEAASEHDPIIEGDADMLRHALENIVRNAIRYSPQNGTVEISIETQEHGANASAVLRVADTGPGVSEDKLKLILNPFYRADESRRGATSGFGVGLAIADRAIHLHSGEIVARNRQEGGLIVEISLPIKAAAL
jgi:two-component system sensor histidine kinase CpxA